MGISILLIDEHSNSRYLNGCLFRQEIGCEVYEVSSIKEAYDVLKRQEIDYLIYDPIYNGKCQVNFLEKIKKSPNPPSVIIYTNYICDYVNFPLPFFGPFPKPYIGKVVTLLSNVTKSQKWA